MRRWSMLLACALGGMVLSSCETNASIAALDAEGGQVPGALQLSGWTGQLPAAVQNGGDLSVRWDRSPRSTDVVPPVVLTAPDTVQVGVAFSVTTYTVAPSGCWRAAGQVVRTMDRALILKPYDEHSGAALCTGALVFPAHPSQVVLDQAGKWTVRVVGRRAGLNGETLDMIVTAEKEIVAR